MNVLAVHNALLPFVSYPCVLMNSSAFFFCQLPSSSTWGQQSNTTACQSQATLSLAEIQKLEEERERQLREEVNFKSDLDNR